MDQSLERIISKFKKPLQSDALSYLQKWAVIAILIGIVSGIGALAFTEAINLFSTLFSHLTGYFPPTPAGEGAAAAILTSKPYLIPIATTLGGLFSGIIVYGIAPEAEGHGTDSAIDAFHNKKGEIRSRIPIVKLLASAITIGSGGSAGREGPTAQMAAGFGSFLGKTLHLNLHDKRIAVAVGIGSGIGSIFKAPFGGAILAAEILYTGDFEVEALLPAFIASAVGYSIFGSVMGWTPVFGSENTYIFQPIGLPFYAILGVACGLMGIAYIRTFYGLRGIFQHLKLPNFVKPAIGGFAVGIIGMLLPQVLGMGYGWLQIIMDKGLAGFSLTILLAIVLLKIVATSLTVGSGGSGGVFAPALVIGGMLGAAMWAILNAILPGFQGNLPSFVIIGMMCFFGGVGKAPVAVMLMVTEMTGSLTLFVPSMVATTIAYIVTGKNTIYKSQVPSRAESPAHKGEYSIPLLQRLLVKDAMTRNVITARPYSPLSEVASMMAEKGINGVPILDNEGNLIGMITRTDILQVYPDQREKKKVEEIMSRDLVVIEQNASLYNAFQLMTGNQIGRLPVVDSLELAVEPPMTKPRRTPGFFSKANTFLTGCLDRSTTRL